MEQTGLPARRPRVTAAVPGPRVLGPTVIGSLSTAAAAAALVSEAGEGGGSPGVDEQASEPQD